MSGRDESAVGEPRHAVVVTVLLQKHAALPGEARRCAAKIELVDFDRLARAVARGVEAKESRRRLGETQAVRIERLEIQRPRTVGIRTRVVLQGEGGAVDELRLRPCSWIDQVQVTGCTVTGRQQKARRPHGQNIFGDDELTDVSQSLLVATIGRRRACLRRRLRDVRILSDDRGRNSPSENDDRDDDPTLQCDHAAPLPRALAVFQARVDLDCDAGRIRDRGDGAVEDELTRHALLRQVSAKSFDVFDADACVIESAAARGRWCRLGRREQQACARGSC